MKLFIYIFYFIFLIVGGFRNYSDELVLHEFANNFSIPDNLRTLIYLLENIGFFVCFSILIFPLKSFLHLLFFLIHFILDLYFQNYIFFEDYIIFAHFIPLFIFLYLTFEKKGDLKKIANLDRVIILIISIAYFTNFIAKASSGWYETNTTVIYDYILLFNKGYQLNFHFSTFFLSIQNYFFYKSLDYLVLLFQFSAIFLFLKYRFFKWFSVIATIFHVGVLLFMEIPIFYSFILLYSLILINKTNTFSHQKSKAVKTSIPPLREDSYWRSFKEGFLNWKQHKTNLEIVLLIILAFYAILFVYFGFDKYFILRNSSLIVYLYHNTIFTFIAILLFINVWLKRYR